MTQSHHHHAPDQARSLILSGLIQRLAMAAAVSGLLWLGFWAVVG